MNVDWTTTEKSAIQSFLDTYFPAEFDGLGSKTFEPGGTDISPEEEAQIEELVSGVEGVFSGNKGALGVAIDFLVVAEKLSQIDGGLSEFEPDLAYDDIFERYPRDESKATLTFDFEGRRPGIRPIHNEVITLFREELNRTNFPSSPGHHTGNWHQYEYLLVPAFRLSRTGRFEALRRLFDLGLERLEGGTSNARDPPFPSPFLSIIRDYPRSASFEEGGTAYQAIAYGFVKVEWPQLSLEASKVRTGSSRQNRYGDVDGFLGPDLMVSVEVKDRHIDETNLKSELGTMMQLASDSTGVVVAMVDKIDPSSTTKLEDSGVTVISQSDLEGEVAQWDYHKQNRAVQGMLHFLENVEENPRATQRALEFLSDVDPRNRALAHLKSEEIPVDID
jgi:hypothetical protein